jgi:hypothetical protein
VGEGELTLLQSLMKWVRVSLLENYTNKVILYSLYEKDIKMTQEEINQIDFFTIFKAMLYS